MLNSLSLIMVPKPQYSRLFSSLLCVVCGALAFVWWPTTFDGFTGDMNLNPHIEYARESAGLLLVCLSQAGAILYDLRRSKNAVTPL